LSIEPARPPLFMAALKALSGRALQDKARAATIGRILVPAMRQFEHLRDDGPPLRARLASGQQPTAARAAAGLRTARPRAA
jgi:hypothetical protein